MFYKLFTHDFRSPLQGGERIWDGSLPFTLPTVKLDTGDAECSHGWNFVDDLAKGFEIAGMWPNGRPSAVAIFEPSKDAIQRGNKWRSSSGKIVGLATEIEIAQSIEQFSKVFTGFEAEMASEQIAWRYALGRPENNEAAAVEALEKALAQPPVDNQKIWACAGCVGCAGCVNSLLLLQERVDKRPCGLIDARFARSLSKRARDSAANR